MKREKENNKDFQNKVFCSLKFKPLIFFWNNLYKIITSQPHTLPIFFNYEVAYFVFLHNKYPLTLPL